LGGNVVRRDLGNDVIIRVSRLLRQSIQYALDHRNAALEYALKYGRDLDTGLADRFVGMYVNHWTLDYGERGRAAVRELLRQGAEAGIVPALPSVDFVNDS
jgi:1,4-dihydroxy-6-naphthoate synthase